MRYSTAVESTAGIAAGAPIAAIYPGTSGTAFALRRLIIGGRAGTDALAVQQLSVIVTRTGSRGSATTTAHLSTLDDYFSSEAAAFVDIAWTNSSNYPTPDTPYNYERSFSTVGGGAELKWAPREFTCEYGSSGGHGIELINVGNAVPSEYLFTVTFEIDQ